MPRAKLLSHSRKNWLGWASNTICDGHPTNRLRESTPPNVRAHGTFFSSPKCYFLFSTSYPYPTFVYRWSPNLAPSFKRRDGIQKIESSCFLGIQLCGVAVESGITAPVTGMTTPDNNNSKDLRVSSFFSSSLPVSDTEKDRHPRAKRLASRRPSGSILVPRDHPEIEIQEEEFPPDDARAMSPRRNPADVERLCREIQEAIQQPWRNASMRSSQSMTNLKTRIDFYKDTLEASPEPCR
ncbi:conserved hypothetical protein [Histoplasma mississippiense (nom. inval.)]|uniref:conserved hypothetical protein n=1 Tax=Ajellomyces capsulatus (strain NAm1 / WU24) TaxID=2059318 RepID=UPI000157CC09|nr:conserved hypothetical protein [Histoplasma mississippiense (nom. inval.)]EDN10525.1 conserved hypothetical protein [Histoplasma mississippiense (nom. inval.)]